MTEEKSKTENRRDLFGRFSKRCLGHDLRHQRELPVKDNPVIILEMTRQAGTAESPKFPTGWEVNPPQSGNLLNS
jgi:hypothetical protein